MAFDKVCTCSFWLPIKVLFTDQYQNILNKVAAVDHGQSIALSIISPATLIGNLRDMTATTSVMATVQKYGTPDYHIKITCNTTWHDINEVLFPCHTAADKPDIVTRVLKGN